MPKTVYRPSRCRAGLCALWTIAAALGTVAWISPPPASTFDETLAEASAGGRYRTPSQAEYEEVYALFRRTFEMKESIEQLRDSWAEHQYQLVDVQENDLSGVALIEKPDSRTGRGLYFFRIPATDAHSWILEMPHSFKDLDTREIGLNLMSEGPFLAAAWNTVPREYDEGETTVDADLSHLEVTYLNAFTEAFARQYPHGFVIQLHGFAQSKRETQNGKTAGIIISSGGKAAAHLLGMDACLGVQFGDGTRVFPVEVSELGGTTNAQGRLLQRLGHGGFVHVEMSRDTRRDFCSNPNTRRELLECLEEHLK